jgi:hypothetical protein
MPRLPWSVLLCSALLVAPLSPSLAAEAWQCEFKSPGRHPDSGVLKIDVKGDQLSWVLDGDPNAVSHDLVVSANTAVGVVAASAKAEIVPAIGRIVDAQFFVLDKSNGRFRLGSLDTWGYHDYASGQCR